MSVEDWESAYVEHLQGRTKPATLSRLRREILEARDATDTRIGSFGPDHPATAALDALCRRGVLVTHTSWLGQTEVAARAIADRIWPEKQDA